MSTRRFFNLAVWLLGFVLVAGLGTAVSQQAAPTETKGVTITPLQNAIDLGPEIEGTQGRQFHRIPWPLYLFATLFLLRYTIAQL